MRKLLRAWCLFAIAALASCQGDKDSTQTSSNESEAVTAKPITLRTDSVGLVPKTTAKGTTVQLEGRFESAVLARRNADGSLSTECHDHQPAAEAFMQGAQDSHTEVK